VVRRTWLPVEENSRSQEGDLLQCKMLRHMCVDEGISTHLYGVFGIEVELFYGVGWSECQLVKKRSGIGLVLEYIVGACGRLNYRAAMG